MGHRSYLYGGPEKLAASISIGVERPHRGLHFGVLCLLITLDRPAMSRHNRIRKNRPGNHPNNNPPSPPPERGSKLLRQFLEMPAPPPVVDIRSIRLGPDEPSPPPENGTDPFFEPRSGSRTNSLKLGLRSRLLFPMELKVLIDQIAADYVHQLKLSTRLDVWLAYELSRCAVQIDKLNYQLLVDQLRVIDKVNTSGYDDDHRERAEKLGQRLRNSPHKVKGELERTKFGALFILDKWTLLSQAVESNGGLDPEQLQVCYDLLGIDLLYRNGCTEVPQREDTEGLRKLIAREIQKHQRNLELNLNARYDAERSMAQLGIGRFHDAGTRALRSDLSKARTRFRWALATIQSLQAGVDPATLTDPETRKPVAPGPLPTAVPDPRRPAATTPPPAPPEPAPRRSHHHRNPCHHFLRDVRRKAKRCGTSPPGPF